MRHGEANAPNAVRQRMRTDLCLCQAVLLCAACWACAACAGLQDLRFRAAADATYDDNVFRARKDGRLEDAFATLNLGANVPFQLSTKTRLLFSANAGTEAYGRFTRLDRYYGSIQSELQYRSSGWFTAPVWAVFARHGQDWYASDLRDGYRSSVGLSVRKPLTDRIFLFSAAAYNRRAARSSVFDNSEASLRMNLDYALTRSQTLYFGLEGRDGAIVSTARPNPAYRVIATAAVLDDAFPDGTRVAYRIKAYTGIASVGYNCAIDERAALDFSYRVAYSRPREQPPSAVTTDRIDYVDNQVTVSLLVRF